MIQYYIRKVIDILTYALKPKYEEIIDNDMQTAYDLSYGSHPQQKYDFYKGTSNKLLLFLHGGAWWATNRQRDYYRGFIEAFHTAHPDINVVNMDYRLLVEDDLTTNVFPNQIDDVQAVMQIFEDYDITIAGNSAGGHLALWYYLNELTPRASNAIPITSAYDGSVVEQSTQYYTKPTGIYFENGIPVWIQNQFVDSSVDMGGATVVEYISPAYYADANLDDILAVFCTRDAEVPINQKSLMQVDYPNIKYVEYDTWHSGWMGTSFASDLRSEMYDFMLKERTTQSQHDAGRYLVQQIPEESTNNRYGHINSPFELNAIGSIDGNTFHSFKGEVMQGIISDYALKKISYNFSSFNRAFNIITPETENGYTFMIIKNNLQRYLLIHKGFSSSKYTIPKGATNQDVEFLILRISDNEVLFFANTPEDWRYEMYYAVPGNPLNASHRHFTNIPSLHIFPNAAALNEYIFRARGEDGDGNLTEWSTDYVDGTDAFFVPLFDNESTNQYMPELEKINLTSNLFSVVFYPTFEQGLGMIGIEHNNDQEILRSTDLDRVYANTSDAVKPNVDAVLEMHRFNNDSQQYPNLLYQLGTQDLDVRAQLEWDAINGLPIPEVEFAEVELESISETEYLVTATDGSPTSSLKFKRLTDGFIEDKGVQTLPYTFTHTGGEAWAVSADGQPYVYYFFNFIPNTDFVQETPNNLVGWSRTNIEATSIGIAKVKMKALSTSTHLQTPYVRDTIDGDIYYYTLNHLEGDILRSGGGVTIQHRWGVGLTTVLNSNLAEGKISVVTQTDGYYSNSYYRIGITRNHNDVDEAIIEKVMAVNLTQYFGAGNEPNKEWCDENIKWTEKYERDYNYL